MEHMKEIARALRCIADELDQDQKMQRFVHHYITVSVAPDKRLFQTKNFWNRFIRHFTDNFRYKAV